jgi:hypothetical protein
MSFAYDEITYAYDEITYASDYAWVGIMLPFRMPPFDNNGELVKFQDFNDDFFGYPTKPDSPPKRSTSSQSNTRSVSSVREIIRSISFGFNRKRKNVE